MTDCTHEPEAHSNSKSFSLVRSVTFLKRASCSIRNLICPQIYLATRYPSMFAERRLLPQLPVGIARMHHCFWNSRVPVERSSGVQPQELNRLREERGRFSGSCF